MIQEETEVISGDVILISWAPLDLAEVAGRLKPWIDWRELWFRQFLTEAMTPEEMKLLRRHERTGRPLGQPAFLNRIERTLHRIVRQAKPGYKRKRQDRLEYPRIP
jgi:hypothetical protein